MKELVHYGIKGMAAYVEHAYNLGYENPEIFAFMQYALAELTREDITVDELITLTLATGNHGVQAILNSILPIPAITEIRKSPK